jgi:hypothetical protein
VACLSCQSENRTVLRSEINIHLPGFFSADVVSVLVYPELIICLDCGFTEFCIPEADLQRLRETLQRRAA